jgi:hypothetical protein
MKGRADSAQAALDSATTTRDSLWAALQGLQARSGEADTLRAALDAQIAATGHLRALIGLSESRIVALEDALGAARGELAKARRPGRLSVGPGIGYGATLSGGRIYSGPTASLQVTYRLF